MSRLLPGPLASLVLADLGATVDKIEDLSGGDYLRVMPPLVGDTSSVFLALNRNKRSAQLDLKKPAARAAFEKNLNNGQAFTDTLRPGDLRSGDILYVEGNTIAVARRDGLNLTRFWLVGSIDLQQAGIVRDAANRYKVTRDTIR